MTSSLFYSKAVLLVGRHILWINVLAEFVEEIMRKMSFGGLEHISKNSKSLNQGKVMTVK